MTLPAMGAEPVTISLQRPPRMALVFLKMILSHNQCVYLPVRQTRHEAVLVMRRRCFDVLALGQPRHFGGDGFANEPGLAALRATRMRRRRKHSGRH